MQEKITRREISRKKISKGVSRRKLARKITAKFSGDNYKERDLQEKISRGDYPKISRRKLPGKGISRWEIGNLQEKITR